jgi:Ca-activated chloride channel family protein
MSFIWPTMLLLLILVPLLVLLYFRLQQRRKRFAKSFGSFGSGQSGPGRGPGARRHVAPLLFLAGLTILVVALARPQTTVSVPRIQGTVILAFDVSGSMAADDMKPTRMDAAKAAAKDFVQRQPPSVQIGVVGFSDSGFAVQPPSNSQIDILATIDRLAPQRGTSLAHGIEASLNTIALGMGQGNQGQAPGEPEHLSNLTPEPTPTPTAVPKGTYTSAVIVLLSDGENNENPDPLAAAQAAADRGVRIYTVGVGSPAGTTLHINGFTVHTQLDEGMLKQISQITDGTYYNATSEQDLQNIYDHLNPQLFVKPEKMEVTSLFAGASVLVLLAGSIFSMLLFSRMP